MKKRNNFDSSQSLAQLKEEIKKSRKQKIDQKIANDSSQRQILDAKRIEMEIQELEQKSKK